MALSWVTAMPTRAPLTLTLPAPLSPAAEGGRAVGSSLTGTALIGPGKPSPDTAPLMGAKGASSSSALYRAPSRAVAMAFSAWAAARMAATRPPRPPLPSAPGMLEDAVKATIDSNPVRTGKLSVSLRALLSRSVSALRTKLSASSRRPRSPCSGSRLRSRAAIMASMPALVYRPRGTISAQIHCGTRPHKPLACSTSSFTVERSSAEKSATSASALHSPRTPP